MSAPNDQPVRINGWSGEREGQHVDGRPHVELLGAPSSWAPALPSTPRKLKRRQATPARGNASNSALMTIDRMVPPYCGCGWHSTIAARIGASVGASSSASSATPSLVRMLRASATKREATRRRFGLVETVH